MIRNTFGWAVGVCAILSAHAFAQTAAPAAQAGQAPAPGASEGGGQGVGTQGDPDPGVHFVVTVDNPSVRVLQVTLQPGAVRRQHVHNDVAFNLLIPVTGSFELTADGLGTVSAVPGQTYYLVAGQPHGYTNRGAAAVQVEDVFVKPGPAPEPWKATNPVPPAVVTPAATAAP